MAKVVDITSKLEFDGNPKLRIKDKEIEVNADAPTMLKVMNLVGDDPTPKEVIALYNLVFSEESRKVLDDMKLNFADLITVVEAAVSVISGDKDTSALGVLGSIRIDRMPTVWAPDFLLLYFFNFYRLQTSEPLSAPEQPSHGHSSFPSYYRPYGPAMHRKYGADPS